MKKNPGRKERRLLARKNRLAEGKERAKANERRQKMESELKRSKKR